MRDPPLLYPTWKSWVDVEAGTTKDEQVAADLAQFVRGSAPREYNALFRPSYHTRGMKDRLKAFCKLISDIGGEVASILPLPTECGGKTPGLITLIHCMRGMNGVANDAKNAPRAAESVASDPRGSARNQLSTWSLRAAYWGERERGNNGSQWSNIEAATLNGTPNQGNQLPYAPTIA